MRELRNEVERYLLLGEERADEAAPSPPPEGPPPVAAPAVDFRLPFKLAKRLWMEPFEREYMRALARRSR